MLIHLGLCTGEIKDTQLAQQMKNKYLLTGYIPTIILHTERCWRQI